MSASIIAIRTEPRAAPMNRCTFLGGSIIAAASLSGCGSRPSELKQLTTSEMEADLAERLKLHEVKLTDEGGGRFTGTGKDAEGHVVELEATQDKRRRTWKHKWKGPDGSGGEGSGEVCAVVFAPSHRVRRWPDPFASGRVQPEDPAARPAAIDHDRAGVGSFRRAVVADGVDGLDLEMEPLRNASPARSRRTGRCSPDLRPGLATAAPGWSGRQERDTDLGGR